MKEFLYTCLIGLMAAFTTHAQDQYESGMTQAFKLWQAQKPVEAANLFERIANAEEEAWLPYYYAAQIKIIESFSMTDKSKKEQQLKGAQDLLNQAMTYAGKENVEVDILQAMLHTAYLTLDPSFYGMKLSPVINDIYTQALQEAPYNPRVVLSKAEWDMGSAQFFGEDPAKYCDDLKRSLRLFEEDKPTVPFEPSWGKDRAEMLIARTCGDKKKE
ncbi:hypothetical protein [Salinimicrobium sp. GXAS 041]|uniref:hypothetical protein n=1 Tax=Salinimicrobium sp. GXAS 041 TaxID=3400806 RepID=UPI003C794D8B